MQLNFNSIEIYMYVLVTILVYFVVTNILFFKCI